MRTVSETIEFIKEAHKGQMYGEFPYWTHPHEVMQKTVELFGEDESTMVAALLHDVVEDTEFGIDYIRENYGDSVADAVALLTKDNSLSYEENINRIIESKNIIAIRVKLADNMVNFTGDKSHMSKERRDKLMGRYQKSMAMLIQAIIQ